MSEKRGHDSNVRLAELLRVGLRRADAEERARVPLKLYSAAEQDELLTLLHAYLWDTAAPHDDEWHRSPGNIMTLWAELLKVGEPTRERLILLRTELVKEVTARGLAYRTHPRSVPVLVRDYTGAVAPPEHPGDPRKRPRRSPSVPGAPDSAILRRTGRSSLLPRTSSPGTMSGPAGRSRALLT